MICNLMKAAFQSILYLQQYDFFPLLKIGWQKAGLIKFHTFTIKLKENKTGFWILWGFFHQIPVLCLVWKSFLEAHTVGNQGSRNVDR